MDSDEGYNYEFDEDEECSEDSAADEPEDELELADVELVEAGLGGSERSGTCGEGGGGVLGPGPGGEEDDDYRYEVLTAEQILQHMVECIREVNEVIQVSLVACKSFGLMW